MKNENILKLPNGKAILLKKKLDNLSKRKDKMSKDWIKLRVDLESSCIHNDYHTFEKHQEGTYYFPGIIFTITECVVCEKILKTSQKPGGYV